MARVIYFEDDESLSALAAKKLEKSGHTVKTFPDGTDALKRVREFRADLILLDVMMPKQNGFEVLKLLKSEEDTEIIPVIMMTALGEKSDVVKSLDLGADDYLLKPFHPKTMVERVEQALRKFRDEV